MEQGTVKQEMQEPAHSGAVAIKHLLLAIHMGGKGP